MRSGALSTIVTFMVALSAGCHAGPSDSAAQSTTTPSQTPGELNVSILGDSYTLATGASAAAKGYVPQACFALNWRCLTSAQAGTGYINRGAQQESFIERVEDLVSIDPDIVVVQGGTFDTDSTPSAIELAAAQLLAKLRSAIPRATVFVVGPEDAPGIKRQRFETTRQAIRAACESASVSFLDPVARNWIADADGYSPRDRLNLSDMGFELFAQGWISAFRDLGLQR